MFEDKLPILKQVYQYIYISNNYNKYIIIESKIKKYKNSSISRRIPNWGRK